MEFYNGQHQYSGWIDLHVKILYVCILDGAGQVLVYRNVASTPAAFFEVVGPSSGNLVVVAECTVTWYWQADVCAAGGIIVVLGPALAMKAIHGGRPKNDTIDAHTIAVLRLGGMVPHAYGCCAAKRTARDQEPQAWQRAALMGRPLSARRADCAFPCDAAPPPSLETTDARR